jgi:hypothetical protein
MLSSKKIIVCGKNIVEIVEKEQREYLFWKIDRKAAKLLTMQLLIILLVIYSMNELNAYSVARGFVCHFFICDSVVFFSCGSGCSVERIVGIAAAASCTHSHTVSIQLNMISEMPVEVQVRNLSKHLPKRRQCGSEKKSAKYFYIIPGRIGLEKTTFFVKASSISQKVRLKIVVSNKKYEKILKQTVIQN